MRPELRSSYAVSLVLTLLYCVGCGHVLPAASRAVLLPDGSAVAPWDRPLQFTKTWHVAQRSPDADDRNPGTSERPLRTIQAAANMVGPAQRVLVHAGVYRELVQPPRGGTGPEAMISYEAAEGETVILRGSDVVEPSRWKPSSLLAAAENSAGVADVRMMELAPALFPGENPFSLINARGRPHGFWFPAYILRRGLVFQDGRRLEQVHTAAELLRKPGTYWVEGAAANYDPATTLPATTTAATAAARPPATTRAADRYILHVRPRSGTRIEGSLLEITTRPQAFAPAVEYLGYIRVKGFTIEQVGNRFPVPQRGALSTSKGHHWLIEGNTLRQVNSIGIDAGHQFGGSRNSPPAALCGYNIVRGNTLSDCGICGIAAAEGLENGRRALRGAWIEDNLIAGTGWHGCEALMENAAIKLHVAENCVVRRNVIVDTHQASGIWLDWQNVNSRVTQNVILDTGTVRAGIFVEATFATNAVDNNIIWDCHISRNPAYYPRLYGGFGVLTTESRNLIVAHNLIARCQGAGVCLGIGNPNRKVAGTLPASDGHQVTGNIILDCPTPIMLPNASNACDYNMYSGVGEQTAWRMEQPQQQAGFVKWRESFGFEAHGRACELRVSIDRSAGVMRIGGAEPLPLARLPFIDEDVTGERRTGDRALAGPFADWPGGPRSICPWRQRAWQHARGPASQRKEVPHE
jgi:hypothetical protein